MRKWLFILGLWAIFGAFYTAQSYTYRISIGRTEPFPSLLLREFLYVGLWASLTPLILALARRFPIDRRTWPARIPLHLFSALALAVLQRLVYELLAAALASDPSSGPRPVFQAVAAYSDYGMFLYFIVLLIAHAVEYYGRYQGELTRAARLRADLTEARLATLRMQLQPHFLFNTLNSISALLRTDPATADRMVLDLSDFLRATLDDREARVVPLRRELALLDSYLQIERTRFGERLRVDQTIAPETLDAEVPLLLLQPLVENAIRHGIAAAPGPGTLSIRSSVCNGRLVLRVANSGAGAARKSPEGFGLGLENTRLRLAQLYGDDPQGEPEVALASNEDGGSTVTVSIPMQAADSRTAPRTPAGK